MRPKAFVKSEFRYNRSIFKEIYAIGVNDVLSYNREFVITEFVINGFNCIYDYDLPQGAIKGDAKL